MSRRKPKAPMSAPTVFEQMTADRARQVVAWLYRVDVCGESQPDFIELRAALKTPERFAKSGKETGDAWALRECDCEPVVLHEPEAEPERVTFGEQPRRDDAMRDLLAEAALYRELGVGRPPAPERACSSCGELHIMDHVHTAIAGPLNALPDGHPLIGPLERADDARSAWMCLYRWAHALAYYWGMDGRGYWRAVDAAYQAGERRAVAA